MMEHDEEEVNIAIWLPADFPMDDLQLVCGLLTEADFCVPGYIPAPVGLYHRDGFFYEHHVEGIKTVVLPDRNVVSRLAQLAQGKVVRQDEQLRLSAGLLAFAQCLDIDVEPSIAFHELAHKQGNEEAWSELAWFRAADNARPRTCLISRSVGRMRSQANTAPIKMCPDMTWVSPSSAGIETTSLRSRWWSWNSRLNFDHWIAPSVSSTGCGMSSCLVARRP